MMSAQIKVCLESEGLTMYRVQVCKVEPAFIVVCKASMYSAARLGVAKYITILQNKR